jgi:hypothetical protein
MNGVALHALAGPIFEVASPRIPMAEEEVLKTFQCGFESHRGYHRAYREHREHRPGAGR